MKTNKRACLGIIALLPILAGMGILGEPSMRKEAPEPEQRFDAIVEDLEGVRIQVTYLSYDGELYLPVYQGRGLITIPFEKIRKVLFGPNHNGQREVQISFLDGTTGAFRMEGKVLFLGKVPYGTFQIEARDLKQIELARHSPE